MYRVLVIDDEIELATLTTLLLKKRGYKAYSLTDPSDSISIAESYHPHVILLDVRLGAGLDGRQICYQLKHLEETRNCKVILYSAYHEHQEDYQDYGADDFIGKPFEMEVLLTKIKHHLENGNLTGN